jgi:hypothetical protein
MREGVAFLLVAEHKRGQCGLWVPRTAKAYNRYHAAYCGVVGLIANGTACDADLVPACFM